MSCDEQIAALRREIAEAEHQVACIEKTCAECLNQKQNIESLIVARKACLEKLVNGKDGPAAVPGHRSGPAGCVHREWATTVGMAQLQKWWGSREYAETFAEPEIQLDTVDVSVARSRVVAMNSVLKEKSVLGGRIVPCYTPVGKQHTAYYSRETY